MVTDNADTKTVAGDPHSGNIYVRAVTRPGNSAPNIHTSNVPDIQNSNAPLAHSRAQDAAPGVAPDNVAVGEGTGVQLVMLDHGCVHTLDEEARVRLCKLVLACVERRSADLQVGLVAV